LVVLGLVLGLGYDKASACLYRPGRVAGFHLGLVHGALMPAALPALLIGRDCPIYANNNKGRLYNIGFILGINACGTVFFGCAFWPSRKR
jgi:hypothetical protein